MPANNRDARALAAGAPERRARASASRQPRPRALSAATNCRRLAAQLTGLKLLRLERQRLAAAKRYSCAGAYAHLPWSLRYAASSVPSDHEPWPRRQLGFGGDCRLSGDGEHLNHRACWLTFELRGRSRRGAWPARRRIRLSASRAKCHAGGGPWLERRVRPHPRRVTVQGRSRRRRLCRLE